MGHQPLSPFDPSIRPKASRLPLPSSKRSMPGSICCPWPMTAFRIIACSIEIVASTAGDSGEPRLTSCRDRLASPADTSDLPIQFHVGGIACDATRICLGRRMMRRRAFGMIMRRLAREGRGRRHKYHNQDRDRRSHFNPPSRADFPRLACRGIQRRRRDLTPSLRPLKVRSEQP
jgi:hypothetical protein